MLKFLPNCMLFLSPSRVHVDMHIKAGTNLPSMNFNPSPPQPTPILSQTLIWMRETQRKTEIAEEGLDHDHYSVDPCLHV